MLKQILLLLILSILEPMQGATFMNAEQFYSAETPNGQLALRQSMEDAIELCYEMQRHPIDERSKLQGKHDWLCSKMNSRPHQELVWSEVRSGSYSTGLYEWLSNFGLEVLEKYLRFDFGYKQNDKPFVIAYTDNLRTPILLVAFPGMEFVASDIITISKFFGKDSFFKSQKTGEKEINNKIMVAAGFLDSAKSAIEKGNLFTIISEILTRHRRNIQDKDVQTVFCGHSLGGGCCVALCIKIYPGF
jgi:hypothetical protein